MERLNIKYICEQCLEQLENQDYLSEKDGYMISLGGWFWCNKCKLFTTKPLVISS